VPISKTAFLQPPFFKYQAHPKMTTNLLVTLDTLNILATRGSDIDTNVQIVLWVRVVNTKDHSKVGEYSVDRPWGPFEAGSIQTLGVTLFSKVTADDLITVGYGIYADPGKTVAAKTATDNSVLGSVFSTLLQTVSSVALTFLPLPNSRETINWGNLGASIASQLGTALVPLGGSALQALSGWITAQLPSPSPSAIANGSADEHGLVAVRLQSFTLANMPKGIQTDYHPGLPTPVSLGPDSKYMVTWVVEAK
jgi:hypothetical protein